jgi:RNA polymerase sigma factor (sigma-70 family)
LNRSLHEAEDVFQACFLELARKAATIRKSGSVAGWLQVVAVRLSRKVKLARLRRVQREAVSAQPEIIPPEDLSWREVCRILEEEVSQLPESLRSPLVLCYFEGQTLDEAAQSLDMNPRTLKDRLRRSRELLEKRLVRRGVSLVVLGTLLSANSAQGAICVTLAQSTLQAAAATAAHAPLTGIASAGAISLLGNPAWFSGWGMFVVVGSILLCSAAVAGVAWNRGNRPQDLSNWPVDASVRPLRTLERTFRDQQFDVTVFRLSGPGPMRYIRREVEGLRIALPPEAGPGEPIGVQLRHPVRGDFELEVTLQSLEIARPLRGPGAGATVYFFLDSADEDGVWFGKMHDPQAGAVFAVGHRIKRGNERHDNFVKKMPARTDAGLCHLRVSRRGSSFSMSGADGMDDEFRPLGAFDIGDEQLSIVRLAADPAWSTSNAVDVRLIDFTLSAEEIVGYEE